MLEIKSRRDADALETFAQMPARSISDLQTSVPLGTRISFKKRNDNLINKKEPLGTILSGMSGKCLRCARYPDRQMVRRKRVHRTPEIITPNSIVQWSRGIQMEF